MKIKRRNSMRVFAILVLVYSIPLLVTAQEPAVLIGKDLSRVVPPGFYFQGLSAPTQMRNSAAVRFGTNRYVVAGLVDTSGYAADVRARYEGFLITDSPITINGSDLGTGAYGFGFNKEGKLNILDLAGNQILSVSTKHDDKMRRPRPLMMVKADGGVRFYNGRDYAVISTK